MALLLDNSVSQDRATVALHRFAVFTAGATFLLIFVGGLVTSTGSALAVPDWPLSFGRLFPKMEGGVLYEHGHRMVAGAVAILTAILAVWMRMREPRVWVRRVAYASLGLVVVQAVLGGLTVLLRLPLAIAVAHAACAQAFFCLMVSLALFTSSLWDSVHIDLDPSAPGARSLPGLAAITTAMIYAQILIGAVMRHMGAGLTIPDFPLSYGHLVPRIDSVPVAINFAHRCGAAIVCGLVAVTVSRTLRHYRSEPLLRRPASALATLLAVQLSLGALTVWSARAVVPTTAHVAIGAAVLAVSLALTLRSFHLLRPREAASPARTAAPMRTSLEAVA